jgi:hypothetical protein
MGVKRWEQGKTKTYKDEQKGPTVSKPSRETGMLTTVLTIKLSACLVQEFKKVKTEMQQKLEVRGQINFSMALHVGG